ncbi:MAG TPA: histone [Candidatus Altiarchaeales archaeon]|nr:MAG: histone [Candidatus Altiarchaeales archaeon ex4484_43]HDH41623.1 histone [Candidatus Altiarchaeales archaeon]
MKMAELPLAPVERVMRNAGADRISIDAVKRAADEAELTIKRLTESAQRIANRDGRKTITSRDITLASRLIRVAEPCP